MAQADQGIISRLNSATFLDGNYTVFGEVLEGMDVVDKIVSQPRDERDNPIERIELTVTVIGPEK